MPGSFVNLVSSEVFTVGRIDLDTDVDAYSWPVWTIVGPASSVRLVNLTTGERIDLTANGGLILGADDVVLIDTRPGAKSLTRDDGANLMPYLTNDSALFPLGATQEISIEVGGATADTRVTMAVHTAYLTV